MNTTSTTPIIYVASLADYNAGTLHGVWIDVTLGKEHVWSEIHKMLAASKEPIAEDWAIHDYEGFAGLTLSEWPAIDDVCKVAELIEEHGPVFAKVVDHFGGLAHGLKEAITAQSDDYAGAFRTLSEFTEEYIEDCYSDALKQLPEFLRYRIDYEGIAHDLELSGDIFTVEENGEVHVFWSRG